MTAKKLPRFSIVLPCFNTDEYLEDTLETLLSQDYPDFEVIVVDGGSTDRTLEILRQYGDQIKWISEPDSGQSNAINKGFRMATGDLHYWANADDPLEPGALRHVAENLTNLEEPQWLVGAAKLIDGSGKSFGIRKVDNVDDTTFLLWGVKWIPTQSVFWNKKMWETSGGFNEDLHYVMDLGLWHCMHQISSCIVTSRVLGVYRLHNDSKSISGVEKSRKERKEHLARIMMSEMRKARSDDEMMGLATKYGYLFDELSDQAALVNRLFANRYIGWILRLYRKKTSWFPNLRV